MSAVLSYFKKDKAPAEQSDAAAPKSPVLKEDDEAFLKRITAEEIPDPNKAVVVLDSAASQETTETAARVPLPTSPPEDNTKSELKTPESGKRNYWAYLQARVPKVDLPSFKSGDSSKQQAGDDLQAIANAVKAGESLAPPVVTADEAEQEKKDLTNILDSLNLSAVNNRAFSFSKESEKLMNDFTQVLKDLINGGPTAYDDLQKLLNNSEKQLSSMFDDLPPFLQKLVKSLPAKMSTSLAPGILAAAADKPGADAQLREEAGAFDGNKKQKRKVPPLKKLVTEQGAVTGLLRGIFNFLKLRFPVAVTGTNVLLSLAVFLLLFVFWYCHKRGRETRLEREKLAADDGDSDESVSASDLDDSILLDKPDPDVARAEAILNRPAPPTTNIKR